MAFSYSAQSAFWRHKDDETAFRDLFWRKLRNVAASIPFTEDLLAAYYCAFDRETPLSVKASLIGALAYFVLPADAVPDLLPVLGFTDDAAVLAGAIKLVANHIRPVHRDAARRMLADLK
ncbi:MAG TPA: YkvA family protein [Pseudolabrys sp.]|jgi:uncharacterized membrane protein YkvA (DUF1232 family)|nr:YkvA family protein [Pseudolabrys sp.]